MVECGIPNQTPIMRGLRSFAFGLVLFVPAAVFGNTIITNTFSEIATIASLWETDTVTVSPLANAQYPQFTSDWQYIYAHNNISADGDVHIDTAIDAACTGTNGNNTGASPIVDEIINATSTQLN